GRGAARRRGRKAIVEYGFPQTKPVERIEILRDDTAIITQCGEIAAQNRNPKGQRFDQREPEPFGEGRQQQRLSTLDNAGCLDIRLIIAFENDAAQRRTAFKHVDRAFGFPAALPDQYEAGASIAELVPQLAPQIEQQQMVLARFDGPDAHKVRWLHRWRIGRYRGGQLDAERCDKYGRGPPYTP